jgi:hypothetical protein
VVDSRRWKGFDLFIAFNDIYFMALMFFLSGLFVWPSLARKGGPAYLRDRGLRLGVPFVLVGIVLMPFAYYPAYRMTGADPAVAAYMRQWLSLGHWTAGPCWFVAVLFAFDSIAVAVRAIDVGRVDALAARCSAAARRPFTCFCVLVTLSAAAYLPLRAAYGGQYWLTAGPFSVQASRVMLYACYFFVGIIVGARGIEPSLLGSDGLLARQWRGWLAAAFLLFVLALLSGAKAGAIQMLSMFARQTVHDICFVLSCAASGFFLTALFLRFGNRRRRIFDSLRANAYGIYLIHYVFACWLQYALLDMEMPAIAKGGIVFVGTLLLSWAAAAAVRQIPMADSLLCPARPAKPLVST